MRSSSHFFAVECMGCGQWETHSEELEALWSCHTTGAGGCGGAIPCVVPAFRARRSRKIGCYLRLVWCSAVIFIMVILYCSGCWRRSSVSGFVICLVETSLFLDEAFYVLILYLYSVVYL